MISQEEVPQSTNHSLSFSSLPHEIVVSCLARVSGSYYPKLCLVSKQFRSIILSNELYKARSQLGTKENRLYVWLKLPTSSYPSWFTLWIRPKQTLTNDGPIKKKSTGNLLVSLPSSYNYQVVVPSVIVGSETYIIGGYNVPSSSVWFYKNEKIHTLCKAPRMSVARINAVIVGQYPKIYVMGGCDSDESMNWGEVFDIKTQTWEPLPDPGPEVRGHLVRKMKMYQKNLYVSSEKKDYIYDTQERRWDVTEALLDCSWCVIEKVRYIYYNKNCWWLDTKSKEWRTIKGLDFLNKFRETDRVEIVNFGGKLVMVWDRFTLSKRNKKIWCAMIALEKSHGGEEIWGKIEWIDDVLMVPLSYTFLDCMVISI
ncbi:Kelch repeat type 1 [Arabidopsis suecica]|uniref:Kelch repeat type 1 n=1 Tax=Arabidopsis suecica TaxID=45249 RepID=A0A8T1YEY3_ARASU|nr:Kelch repeat type 1 [Arabidopsis suecica]